MGSLDFTIIKSSPSGIFRKMKGFTSMVLDIYKGKQLT